MPAVYHSVRSVVPLADYRLLLTFDAGEHAHLRHEALPGYRAYLRPLETCPSSVPSMSVTTRSSGAMARMFARNVLYEDSAPAYRAAIASSAA